MQHKHVSTLADGTMVLPMTVQSLSVEVALGSIQTALESRQRQLIKVWGKNLDYESAPLPNRDIHDHFSRYLTGTTLRS